MTVTVWVEAEDSVTVNVITVNGADPVFPSTMLASAIDSDAGVFTVMVKVCAALVSAPPPLSWSCTVTVALPVAPVAGV